MGTFSIPNAQTYDVGPLEKSKPTYYTPPAWQSFKDSMQGAIDDGHTTQLLKNRSLVEFGRRNEEVIEAEELNKRFKNSGVTFDRPMNQTQAEWIIENKEEERKRNDKWERAGSWTTSSGAAATAGAVVGAFADPIDAAVGMLFMPSRLMGSGMAMREAAANSASRATRFGAAAGYNAIDAAAGAAILEPFSTFAHKQYYDDYSLANSFANVAFGGALGGLIGGVSSLGYKPGPRPLVQGRITANTNARAVDSAAADIVAGREVETSHIVASDPNIIAKQQLETAQAAANQKEATAQADLAKLQSEFDEIADVEVPKELMGMIKQTYDDTLRKITGNSRVNFTVDETKVKFGPKSVEYDLDGIELNGIPFKRTKNFEPGIMPVGFKDVLKTFSSVPGPTLAKPKAFGAVVVEPDGRIWVVHPKNGFGGYKTTFPKGRPDQSEQAYRSAVREVYEETGLEVEGSEFLMYQERTTTTTSYMIAKREGGSPQAFGDETEGVSLMTVKELRQRFLDEGNDLDLEVLEHLEKRLVGNNLGSAGLSAAELHPYLVELPPEVEAQISKTLDFTSRLDGKKNAFETVDISELTQVGGQLGSNPGAMYQMADGSQMYVKFPTSVEHGKAELAASLMYNLADANSGLNLSPKFYLVTNGDKLGIGSKVELQEARPVGPDELADMIAYSNDPYLEADARQIGGTWVFDAWMANWDVYGTAPTYNIIYGRDELGNMRFQKIDFGGALQYRAQGEPKPGF
jgi:8-oxo-dGTP pyrophosphatase MutT (NUDIX family)